jgi:hypothetical protein
MFPLFATGVFDNGCKFAASAVDTGGNLPSVSLTSVANLPPLSTTPAVQESHLLKMAWVYWGDRMALVPTSRNVRLSLCILIPNYTINSPYR